MSLLRKPVDIALLGLCFARDLVLSSLQVARTVLTPGQPASPRFCVVPLGEARTGFEITLVANYITLTPGTLTVDITPDRTALLVHSLLAGESGDSVRDDVRSIEARVLRVTR